MPVPDWWLELARSKSPGQTALARLLAPKLGVEPTQATISRCLSGESSTLEMVSAISEVLAIPRPVFFAESATESMAFETAKRLYQADMAISAARASATQRHTDPVSSSNDETGGGRERKR